MAFNYRGGSMMQGAALENQQQQSIFDQIARGIATMQQNKAMEQRKKEFEVETGLTREEMEARKAAEEREAQAEANDPKSLAAQGFMTQAQGGTPTPEQMAAMRYADAQNLAKVTTDQYGNRVTNNSIFDTIMGNQGAQGGFIERENLPPKDYSGAQRSDEAAPIYGESAFESIAPPKITNKAEEMRYDAQLDKENKRFSADEDIRKETAITQEKAKLKKQKEDKEKNIEDDTVLSTLGNMLEYNSKTWQAPYSGTAQPITRLTDKEAAKNMALLKQDRLGLAAPLAKQLGVNPTDKDFQNTLDQIFNENEDGATRDALIRNMIAKIERRKKYRDPAEERQERSKKARNNSENLTPKLDLGSMTKEQRYEAYQRAKAQRGGR